MDRPPHPVGVVANGFASVPVSIDDAGNSPRLRLVDEKTGRVGYLDAQTAIARSIETCRLLKAGR